MIGRTNEQERAIRDAVRRAERVDASLHPFIARAYRRGDLAGLVHEGDPTRFAKTRGAVVETVDSPSMPHPDPYGALVGRASSSPRILVSSAVAPERRNDVIAHECAHLDLAEHAAGIGDASLIEFACDVWALAFLEVRPAELPRRTVTRGGA